MRVFLIPIGPDAYEPYFEPVESAADAVNADTDAGWLSRQKRKLADMLREAEAERHRRQDEGGAEAAGTATRWRRRVMRWIVERAAEQRLLWHLRTAATATLVIPTDLAPDRGLAILKQGLKTDSDRHLRWFVVNLAALLVALPFALLPGPNLFGYFFTFTTVGHLLAWRGAQQGLHRVAWQMDADPHVTDIRAAVAMTSPAREDHLHDVATRLGLRHLATFVARLAVPPA